MEDKIKIMSELEWMKTEAIQSAEADIYSKEYKENLIRSVDGAWWFAYRMGWLTYGEWHKTEKQLRMYLENVSEENKQDICDALCETYRLTRAYPDLESIAYEHQDDWTKEIVVVKTATNQFQVDVTADSGTALIRDIVNRM